MRCCCCCTVIDSLALDAITGLLLLLLNRVRVGRVWLVMGVGWLGLEKSGCSRPLGAVSHDTAACSSEMQSG